MFLLDLQFLSSAPGQFWAVLVEIVAIVAYAKAVTFVLDIHCQLAHSICFRTNSSTKNDLASSHARRVYFLSSKSTVVPSNHIFHHIDHQSLALYQPCLLRLFRPSGLNLVRKCMLGPGTIKPTTFRHSASAEKIQPFLSRWKHDAAQIYLILHMSFCIALWGSSCTFSLVSVL